MTVLTSYLLAFYSLVLLADPGIPGSGNNTVQPGEWLLFETLDLQLNGPCYDVAFYRDEILFIRSGEERLYRVPMLRPDPSFSQVLFTNRDLSCSPAALSFSSDYSKGFCTRPVMGNEQVYMEKIFAMDMESDQVSGLTQLSFSRDPSRTLHPALSSDGSMMVFASDRLPTSGGLDLFVTHLDEQSWSAPENLGEYINTSGHEFYPFLDHMNNLWFSSSGHDGYGGFDIYLCPYLGGEWGAPRNLGSTVNGPENELGFSVHPRRQVALFSRTWPSEEKGAALMISLNEAALDAAGITEAAARDIILLLQGMSNPAAHAVAHPADENIEDETAADETAADETIENEDTGAAESQSEPDPDMEEVTVSSAVAEESLPADMDNQDPVIFRIQIISSLYENSFPTVLIDGISFETHEYFYLGSYRITVGSFYRLDDAKAFRLRCLDSGFKQAFVAAFRNGERVTDPSVFKQ